MTSSTRKTAGTWMRIRIELGFCIIINKDSNKTKVYAKLYYVNPLPRARNGGLRFRLSMYPLLDAALRHHGTLHPHGTPKQFV